MWINRKNIKIERIVCDIICYIKKEGRINEFYQCT